MPCLLALLVLAFPRVAIVTLYLFTNFFGGVYDGVLIPLLGFLFMPVTLVAYTWLAKYPNDGLFLIVMIIAVIIDLGSLGGGNASRRKKN